MNAGRGGIFASMFGGGNQGQQEEPGENEGRKEQTPPEELFNENQLELDENGEEGGGDKASLLSEFFTEDEDDEEEESGRGNGDTEELDENGKPIKKDPNAEMTARIADMMKNLRPAEDAIPEDFDPNDPKQLRDVFAKIQQQTAQTSLQMMLIPMQQAFTQLTEQMRNDMKQQLSEFAGQNDSKTILSQLVPEVENPEHSSMINALFEQAKKKKVNGKNLSARQAAEAVRQMVNQLGIKRSRSNQSQDPSRGGSGGDSNLRTGRAALDVFAPLKL